MGMRLDEEFGADRVLQIETDDEENEAHDTVNEDDDTGSDLSNHSVHAPFHSQLGPHDSPTWPQSYRYFFSIGLLIFSCMENK